VNKKLNTMTICENGKFDIALQLYFPKSAVRGSWKRRTFVTRKRAKFTGAFLLRWRQWMLIISELKQATFLTTRTAWVTSKDWVKNVDWLITSNLLPVNVRVVKNVTGLNSLVFCTNDAIWHGERPLCQNWFSHLLIQFFIKIQNQASDTSRSLPSFSSAPFLQRAVPSERLGQVY
jgi:hypothetical protein